MSEVPVGVFDLPIGRDTLYDLLLCGVHLHVVCVGLIDDLACLAVAQGGRTFD